MVLCSDLLRVGGCDPGDHRQQAVHDGVAGGDAHDLRHVEVAVDREREGQDVDTDRCEEKVDHVDQEVVSGEDPLGRASDELLGQSAHSSAVRKEAGAENPEDGQQERHATHLRSIDAECRVVTEGVRRENVHDHSKVRGSADWQAVFLDGNVIIT